MAIRPANAHIRSPAPALPVCSYTPGAAIGFNTTGQTCVKILIIFFKDARIVEPQTF